VIQHCDDHSVIWTKPDDLPIDMDQPFAGLRWDVVQDAKVFYLLRADGSAQTLPDTISPATWLKLLTRAGGEVVGKLP
ncbi:hypothetical protein OAK91_07040, partial [Planctomycetaceae bacterium]|nr:hypothetical protein [Planctomycetaceae bacterium]